MLVSTNEAQKCFQDLKIELRHPSFSPQLLNFQVKQNQELCHFTFQQNDDVFLYNYVVNISPENGIKDISTPFGFGGPIATSAKKSFVSAANKLFFDFAIENQYLAEVIKFVPEVRNEKFSTLATSSSKQIVLVDLAATSDLADSYAPSLRADLKKIQDFRVYRTKETQDISEFARIYKSSMDYKNARANLRFEVNEISELLRLEQAVLYMFSNAEGICGGAVFLVEGIYAQYYLSASDINKRNSGVLKVIIDVALHDFQDNGIKSCNLGGGLSDSIKDSLFFSKSRFSKNFVDFKVGTRVFHDGQYNELMENFGVERAESTKNLFFYRNS